MNRVPLLSAAQAAARLNRTAVRYPEDDALQAIADGRAVVVPVDAPDEMLAAARLEHGSSLRRQYVGLVRWAQEHP